MDGFDISLFIAEKIEENIKKSMQSDKTYNDLYNNHLQESQRYNEIMETLNEEDKSFMQGFIAEIYAIEERKQRLFYFQGCKNCADFLKFIKIL